MTTTREKLEALAAKIDALSPAAQLLMASQIMNADPEMACTIAQKAIDQVMLAKLLGRVLRDDGPR